MHFRKNISHALQNRLINMTVSYFDRIKLISYSCKVLTYFHISFNWIDTLSHLREYNRSHSPSFIVVSRFKWIIFANVCPAGIVRMSTHSYTKSIRATFCRREVHSAVTSSYVFRMRNGTSSAWRHNHSVLVNHRRNDRHFRKAWRWCTLTFKMHRQV